MNIRNIKNSLLNGEGDLCTLICQLVDTSEHSLIWHPLGFMMLNVGTADSMTLRMHIWPSTKRVQQEPAWLIHNHTFSLKSLVVFGNIKNTRYSVVPGNNNSCLYEVSYSQKKSLLTKTDVKLCFKEKIVQNFKYRDIYEVESGKFHSSTVKENGTTVTLCETKSSNDSAPPLVVGDLDGLSSYSYTRNTVSKDDYMKMLQSLDKELKITSGRNQNLHDHS